MRCFRISKKKHIENLDGLGAYLSGGRWNNKGVPMVYTAESRALAFAETLVHLPLGLIPEDFMIAELSLPPEMVIELNPERIIGMNWKSIPPSHETQIIGDGFITEEKYLGLRVPSAVVKGDFNIILNPNFPNFTAHVKIVETTSFPFDKRLLLDKSGGKI